jgi:hypothetical protein
MENEIDLRINDPQLSLALPASSDPHAKRSLSFLLVSFNSEEFPKTDGSRD